MEIQTGYENNLCFVYPRKRQRFYLEGQGQWKLCFARGFDGVWWGVTLNKYKYLSVGNLWCNGCI